MKQIRNKILAFVLATMVVITLTPLPGGAFANENTDTETPSVSTDVEPMSVDADIEPMSVDADVEPVSVDTDVEPVNLEETVATVTPQEPAAESADLFLEYLEKDVAGLQETGKDSAEQKRGVRKASGSAAGDRLTGANKTIYDYLNMQFEQVAAGELAETEFAIPVSVIWPDKEYWTSEELDGIPVVVDGKFNNPAKEKFLNLYGFKFATIVDAVLADNPYELYWYDKTTSTFSDRSNLKFVASRVPDEAEYVLKVQGTVTFSFPVAEEYSATEITETGEVITVPYKVDTAIGQSASKVIENARDIVDRYARANDDVKLHYYCNEICDLVSYNYAAAYDDDTPYGNPWQLIWVFDRDSTTNVVCEGYSKAFQLLCDLSTFTEDIRCISINGDMGGGTGTGPHMWNIVRMDDGLNYLVDVTNCDSGTIGYQYLLFLAGYKTGSISNGYTYSCDGANISYYYDDDMVQTFGEEALTMSPTVYKLHYWDNGEVTQPPTCTETGILTQTCSDCGLTREETIPALGHLEEPIPAVAPTCTEKGWTEGVKCARCDLIFEEPEEVPQLGHSWGSWTTVTEADCTHEGQEVRACRRCTIEQARKVEPLGHSEETIPAVEPTCTETGLTEGVKCSRCQEILTAQSEVAALGHHEVIMKGVAPTYMKPGLTAGKKCDRCNEILIPQITIPSLPRVEITPKVSLSKTKFVYNGKVQKPKVTVKHTEENGTIILDEGQDYTLNKLTSKNVGKYTVKVTMTNVYKGSGQATFTIVPKGTSITALTATRKGFTVKWKKQATQTTGYQIQYATNSKFTTGKKLITITKTGTISKKVTNLKAKKKYYVRVRTYKTVNGVKYCSAWTTTKSVTTRN